MFDADGDGVITIEELKSLISKVGGDMSEGEAKALIHQVKINNVLLTIKFIIAKVFPGFEHRRYYFYSGYKSKL